jgi:hypothetical protein
LRDSIFRSGYIGYTSRGMSMTQYDEPIYQALADRMGALGALVWKIPDIDRVGMSSHEIEAARGSFIIFSGVPRDQEGWRSVAEIVFGMFTGGRQEHWEDFEFVFWNWLEWVFDEEHLPEEYRPEFPEMDAPPWFEG